MRRKDVHNPKIAIYRYIELPHTVCKVNEIYEDDNLWFDCSSKVWDIFLQRFLACRDPLLKVTRRLLRSSRGTCLLR